MTSSRPGEAIKLRAERMAGEFLRDDPRYGRGRKSLTVSDLGIDDNAATRWQRLASISEDAWEEYIAKIKDRTQNALLTLARQYAMQQP